MAIFTVYDGSDVTKLTAALLASSSGVTISNVALIASGAEAVIFYDGSLAALGIGAGLLITSGATPGTSNTMGWFGQDNSGISGFANGDPNIDAVVNTVFQTQSYDATTLSFDFVADPGATSISFALVFGSDEFPEWVDQFVDCAVVMVNGVNYALFNHDPSHPLSVVSANLAAGYFQDNANGMLPIEYDGVSHVLKIVAPIVAGEINHIKIGIADTGDHIYDSGLFLSGLSAGNIPGSGVVVTPPVPCTDGSDNLSGTSKDEYFDLLGGDDTCYAGGGDDIVDAGRGNDIVYGGSGADQLKGGQGRDDLDGGEGIDTAVYAGASVAYAIAVAGGVFTITDLGFAGEGSDNLTNVERLKFSDGLFALDLGGSLTPVTDPAVAPPNAPGSLSIVGIGSAGKTLKAAVSDPDGISAPIAYEWQVSDDGGTTWTRVGTDSNSYTIAGSGVGQAVRVVVSYVDDAAHEESLASVPKAILSAKNGDLVVTLMHLDAPVGATVVNPLTTLLKAAIDLGVTPNVAALGLKAALGLPAAIDLGNYDALAALQVDSGDPLGLAVEKVAVQVAILTSLSDDDTGVGLALALLNASAAGQTLDLASANDLATILGIDITGLSKNQYPQPLREIFDRNKSLADAIGDGGTVAAIEAEWQNFLSIQDGVASTSIADLSIHVNQAPTGSASASLADGIANSPYSLAGADLLQGFGDPDGDALGIAGLSADKGAVVDKGDGTFVILPVSGYIGPVELSYVVVDGAGGSIAANQLFVVVADNPPSVVSMAVPLVAQAEGDSGVTVFAFAVSLDLASPGPQIIDWTVAGAGDHPTVATDFAGGVVPSGTLTFAAGQTSGTIVVSVAGDAIVEFDEFFTVTLSNPSAGLMLGTASATGDIQNEDRAYIAVAPLSAVEAEGSSGTTVFTFTVNLDQASVFGTQTADWAVAGAGANPANAADFGGTFPSGTVSFAAGETNKTITILVAGDTATEFNEDFAVTLLNLSAGLASGSMTAVGTILNDDLPVVAVTTTSVAAAEGDLGPTLLSFTVSLDRAGLTSQSVDWAVTGAGLHPADAIDFAGGLPSGTLIFAAGETSKTVVVPVAGDNVIEFDEGFILSLSNPSASLTLGAATGAGTIQNDDFSVASIAALSASQAEGNSGTTAFTFTASRAGDSASAASVAWAASGSGASPADAVDFAGGVMPAGVLSFAAGETSKTLSLSVAGDTTVEADNGFVVTLSNPSRGLSIATASAGASILNDDLKSHDDAFVVLQGRSLTAAAAAGVLDNDESILPSVAALQSGPAHGQLQLSADGGLGYTPIAGFSGIDTFSYHATGVNGAANDGQASIYVVPANVGTSTTLDLLGLTAAEQIAATYTAFFGRAADAGGHGFWVGEFVQNLPTQGPAALFANIASSFGISAEAKALYPFFADPFNATDAQISAFLDSVYNNLFNRSSDAGGLAYWTGEIKSTLQAGIFVGSVLVNIMSGAQDTPAGKDITTLMGKVAVSLEYVHEQQEHGAPWRGASDVAAATALLETVTADPISVLVGIRNAETLVGAQS